MDNAFKQTQETLNGLQNVIKERLLEIQSLDKQCLQLDLQIQQMRENYLNQGTQQFISEHNSETQNENLLEEIKKLQEELKVLSRQKVSIAQSLQEIISSACHNIDQNISQTMQREFQITDFKNQVKSYHLYNCGLKKHKGRQKNINPQIKAIIQEYYGQQLTQIQKKEPQLPIKSKSRLLTKSQSKSQAKKQSRSKPISQLKQVKQSKNQIKYCICPSQSHLLYPGNMIGCENVNCPVGWYHFECVGITEQNIPHLWYCELCVEKHTKDLKKVVFKLQNVKIEKNISKEKLQAQRRERRKSKRVTSVQK